MNRIFAVVGTTMCFVVTLTNPVNGALSDGPLLAVSRLENHSWTEASSDSTSTGGPTSIEGKTDGNGLTTIAVITTNRTIEGYLHGNNAYVTSHQRNWRSDPRMNKGESPGAFMTRMIRGITPPAQELAILLNSGEKVERDGDVISGDIPEGLARKLLEAGTKRTELKQSESKDPQSKPQEAKQPVGAEGQAPVVAAAGNMTLWTKDGLVTKYEVRLRGKVQVDGKETEVVRTRTVEIKDVGTTKIVLPEAARRKLGLENQ
jgi:hypothetical protein